MRIIRPKKLKTDDAVVVVSPSQPISSLKNFKRGIKTLEGLGFEVCESQNVKAHFGMYEAGTAKQRADDLNQAFQDKNVKGIFMSGGGFLANKVLPLLDWRMIRENPKVIMGFSDGTTWLNAIFAKTGLVTFHGFCIEHFFKRSTHFTVDAFSRIVQDDGVHFYPRTNWRILHPGRTTGRLLGGNLLSFVNLLGTSYCPDLTKSILFFEEHEDCSENVENSLQRLINADVLGGNLVQGIIFGKFVKVDIGSGDPETKKWKRPPGFTLYKILKDLFQDHPIPILANVDFGYTSTPLTMPIGVKAVMDLTKHQYRPYFKLIEPAVR